MPSKAKATAKTKTRDLTQIAPEDRTDAEAQEAFERWRKYQAGSQEEQTLPLSVKGGVPGSGQASPEPLQPYLHGMSSVMEGAAPFLGWPGVALAGAGVAMDWATAPDMPPQAPEGTDNPKLGIIPTGKNIGKFNAAYKNALKAIMTLKRQDHPWATPAPVDEAMAFWEARHPGLNRKIAIKKNMSLPAGVRGLFSGEQIAYSPTARKTTLGFDINPISETAESHFPSVYLDTIGHEARHAIDFLRNPKIFEDYPKRPDLEQEEYENHPAERRARKSGYTAYNEFENWRDLSRSAFTEGRGDASTASSEPARGMTSTAPKEGLEAFSLSKPEPEPSQALRDYTKWENAKAVKEANRKAAGPSFMPPETDLRQKLLQKHGIQTKFESGRLYMNLLSENSKEPMWSDISDKIKLPKADFMRWLGY